VKPAWILLVCLLIAACAPAPVEPDSTDGEFVSEAEDANANHDNEVKNASSNRSPLTPEELKAVALKVSELENTKDDAQRNKLLDHLVSLGPRYLKFFREVNNNESRKVGEVNNENISLDMMYVIRRIERENEITPNETAENPKTDETGKTDRGGAGDGLRIDYGNESEDFDREEVERFMAARLEQARRHLEGGRFDAAKRIAEAAITLLPDSRMREEFDALLVQAKGESQANLLIAGVLTLEPENLQYESDLKGALFKQPLQIRCFLKNVSTEPITLLLFNGEGKESILQLSVTYEQHDYQGNLMVQRGNVRLPIDAGDSITLQPNDSYELTVPLESLASLDSDASRKNALGRVEIDAALRLYGASDAEDKSLVLRPVQFPIRTVWVYPSSFDLEGAASKPVAALRKALDEGWAQELFMASHLVAKKDHRAAGDLLVADDYDDSTLAMQRARLLSMSVVFDTGKSWDIKRWRTWWTENRLR
jgi:hypothetical protein